MKKWLAKALLIIPVYTSAQISEVNVTDDGYVNEPSVAIDPADPNHLVAGSNIKERFESFDGGTTWNRSSFTSAYGFYGDPVLHYTTDGRLFVTHLSQTPGKAWGAWFDRIVVDRLYPDTASFEVGYNGSRTQDKPWLSSDEHSLFKGSIYVTWTEFDKYGSDDPEHRSRIRFASLKKDGNTFSDAITISDSTGDCRDSDSTLEGATTAIGPQGEIYAVWSGANKLWFDKSTDGGKTWGEDRILADHVAGWDMKMPNIHRANGMPFLACDTVQNILYMTWADEYSGNADIWLMYSRDGGVNWSERIRLNLDETTKHQYFPNVAIDQRSGKVLVAYYDQRRSDRDVYYDIYISTFTPDEGVNEYRLTGDLIPLPGERIFFGDYLDIDVQHGRFAVVYAANRFPQHTIIKMIHGPIDDLADQESTARTNPALIHRNDGQNSIYLHPMFVGSVKVILIPYRWPGRLIVTMHPQAPAIPTDRQVVDFKPGTYRKIKIKHQSLPSMKWQKQKYRIRR